MQPSTLLPPSTRRNRYLGAPRYPLCGLACAVAFTLTHAGPVHAATPADIQQRIVTAENAPFGGGMLAPAGALINLPGMPAPLDPDGVVSLIGSTGGVFSSGALIADRYVLTAAHSVDSTASDTASNVSFNTAAGFTNVPIHNVVIHPLYDRTVENGYDIAVIELANDAPIDAPRYDLHTTPDELGQLHVKLGYGRTGHGSTGATSADGQRRVGLNQYDATSLDYNNSFGANMRQGAYLMYDFDNGLAQNDAWGTHGGPVDLGYGEYEVNTTSGDSGGPTFIHNGSDWRIAGVTAWGVGLDADPPDVTPSITDGSFGEISADSRVSSYFDFVNAVVDGTYVVPVISSFSHGNHRPERAWNRPNEQGNALQGNGLVTYHATSFTVDETGSYDITSLQNFDGVVHLYQGGFDPNNPLAGVITGNDDDPLGEAASRLSDVALQTGTTYTLVTSGSTDSETGTFQNIIDGPGQALAVASQGGLTGAVAPDQWQFSSDQTDGRFQTDTAPNSFTIYGGDDFTGGNTDVTLGPLAMPTTLRFDWTYFTDDKFGFDMFAMLVGDEFRVITTGNALYGSKRVELEAGQTFTLRIFSPDGANGPGIATIDRFHIIGDMNVDGMVTNADISAFILALTDPAGYATAYPGMDANLIGDFNDDGLLTNGDIAGLVDALIGGGGNATVPEPTSLALLGLGGLLLVRRR